jgi:hypothetical protein
MLSRKPWVILSGIEARDPFLLLVRRMARSIAVGEDAAVLFLCCLLQAMRELSDDGWGYEVLREWADDLKKVCLFRFSIALLFVSNLLVRSSSDSGCHSTSGFVDQIDSWNSVHL